MTKHNILQVLILLNTANTQLFHEMKVNYYMTQPKLFK